MNKLAWPQDFIDQYIGIDIKADYIKLNDKRLAQGVL